MENEHVREARYEAKLLTVAEAAKIIDRSTSTIYRWIASDELPLFYGRIRHPDLEATRARMREHITGDNVVRSSAIIVDFDRGNAAEVIDRLIEGLRVLTIDADWSTLKVVCRPHGDSTAVDVSVRRCETHEKSV